MCTVYYYHIHQTLRSYFPETLANTSLCLHIFSLFIILITVESRLIIYMHIMYLQWLLSAVSVSFPVKSISSQSFPSFTCYILLTPFSETLSESWLSPQQSLILSTLTAFESLHKQLPTWEEASLAKLKTVLIYGYKCKYLEHYLTIYLFSETTVIGSFWSPRPLSQGLLTRFMIPVMNSSHWSGLKSN